MKEFYQGDIIKINGFGNVFLIVSKNAFIKERKMFHVSPIVNTDLINPMNIPINGVEGTEGTVICEEIKLIDPVARVCNKVDRINYWSIINISDAIQGMFEYD
ncbi:hypothetical protein [Pseudobutyrivibrio xylanivorans]|uniref:mRNA interferase MazF n=1 Tax=Pseudobutyrivibrio xylanivorans DSM 14809 TaxID=1123012 RepID=A0A1M6GLC1_PSEXY|nr:hypothetical protein [Pseudobutyrivibrio xylanivorans]SHJ10713.1 hypothetical protein SAMN02745725_01769 [Pseudobutyrivibrio xylanivorans DSM 14809]